MHILFTRFPLESTLGGAEIQTLTLMEGLIERGHTVEFAGSCPTLLAECNKRNIPVTKLDIGNPPVTKWGALSFVWRKRSMRKKLKALLDQQTETSKPVNHPPVPNGYVRAGSAHKLDLVCMLSLSEKLLLTDVVAAKNIAPIWIEHDRIGRWLTKNPWLKTLLKQSALATTVTVSALSKRMYVDLGWDKNKVITIPNGIDPSRISASLTRKPANPQTRNIAIGCIARLSSEKGVDVLIRAMAKLPKNTTLEIVGTGPEQSTLQSLIQSLALQDRVSISDKSPDLTTVFDRFDALVLPSRDHDPFGLVAAEAMMYGLPVIVTDACGIAGDLTHKTDALIVPADNIEALAEAITSVADLNIRQQLSEHGKKTAEKKFSAKQMTNSYVSLFTRVTHSNTL